MLSNKLFRVSFRYPILYVESFIKYDDESPILEETVTHTDN